MGGIHQPFVRLDVHAPGSNMQARWTPPWIASFFSESLILGSFPNSVQLRSSFWFDSWTPSMHQTFGPRPPSSSPSIVAATPLVSPLNQGFKLAGLSYFFLDTDCHCCRLEFTIIRPRVVRTLHEQQGEKPPLPSCAFFSLSTSFFLILVVVGDGCGDASWDHFCPGQHG